jgi:uncharacterized protein (DUF58 family)
MDNDNRPQLLAETLRRKLSSLMLVSRKMQTSNRQGDRRSTKYGASIEFADYRDYVAGDDLRRLDWNIYARTDRPYIKLLEDEQDLSVHILLDTSLSMDYPNADANKLNFAKQLMAGLAYMALYRNDNLTLAPVGSQETFGAVNGRGHIVPMLRYVQNITADGQSTISQSLKDYASRARRAGMCFILSDLFSQDGYIDGINALIGRGFEVVLLHLLAPEEVTPSLAGDLSLIDLETGQTQEVSVDNGMRDLYIKRVETWRQEIMRECGKRGAIYLPVQTDVSAERVLLYDLRRLGVIR